MEFSDMRVTADEYFDILRKAWENSPYFDGWEREWHPEDLYFNFDSIFRGVGEGLAAYTNLVGIKTRRRTATGGIILNTNVDPKNVAQKVVDSLNDQHNKSEQGVANTDRVQVFGGTIPEDYGKRRTKASTTYTGNTFGDNV